MENLRAQKAKEIQDIENKLNEDIEKTREAQRLQEKDFSREIETARVCFQCVLL